MILKKKSQRNPIKKYWLVNSGHTLKVLHAFGFRSTQYIQLCLQIGAFLCWSFLFSPSLFFVHVSLEELHFIFTSNKLMLKEKGKASQLRTKGPSNKRQQALLAAHSVTAKCTRNTLPTDTTPLLWKGPSMWKQTKFTLFLTPKLGLRPLLKQDNLEKKTHFLASYSRNSCQIYICLFVKNLARCFVIVPWEPDPLHVCIHFCHVDDTHSHEYNSACDFVFATHASSFEALWRCASICFTVSVSLQLWVSGVRLKI